MEDAQRQTAPLESLHEKQTPARTLIEFLQLHPVPTQENEPAITESPKLPSLQMEFELSQRIWCRRKLRMVSLDKCLEDYVEHTALEITQSDCTDCHQGAWNRRCFARS